MSSLPVRPPPHAPKTKYLSLSPAAALLEIGEFPPK